MALVLENGVWKLQEDGATSTVIWSADFTTESSHDFTSTGTATIQGVDWTIANATNATTFQITNGTGLEIVVGANVKWVSNNGAPEITADFSDLAALGAGGSFDVEKMYVWRILMTAGSPQPAADYEGPFCGLRTSATLTTIGTQRHLGLIYDGGQKVRTGKSTSLVDDLASTSWPVGAQNPRTLTNTYFRGVYQTIASDNEESSPLGGKVGYIGYQRNVSTTGQTIDTSTPTFDLTAAAAKAYIGCNGRGTGNSQKFIVEKAELHEL
jgi:hypothetical protein